MVNSVVQTTMITDGQQENPFDEVRLTAYIDEVSKDYPTLGGELLFLKEKVIEAIASRVTYSTEQITNLLILQGLERIDEATPDWTYFCAAVYAKKLYKEAACSRGYEAEEKYGSFYHLLKALSEKGIYNPELLRQYKEEEIHQIGQLIDAEKDKLFTYIGLRTLADRYLAKDHDGKVYELPQERLLIIAMLLMMNEPKAVRLSLIEEAYWALSNLYMTVATPTLANAGKNYGQLSSCFIDTVDDSLDSIMMNNFDVARLSKGGGGIN